MLFFIADCTYTGYFFMRYFWIFLYQFWFVLILFVLRYFILIVSSRKQHARCLISIAFRLYIFYINMIIYFLNNVLYNSNSNWIEITANNNKHIMINRILLLRQLFFSFLSINVVSAVFNISSYCLILIFHLIFHLISKYSSILHVLLYSQSHILGSHMKSSLQELTLTNSLHPHRHSFWFHLRFELHTFSFDLY